MKRVAFTIGMVLVVGCSSLAQQPSTRRAKQFATRNLSERIDQVRNSVAQVEVEFGGGCPEASGTAFLVNDDGFAVTARHVIYAPNCPPPVSILYRFRAPTVNTQSVHILVPWVVVLAEVVAVDEPHDIAILKAKTNSFSKMVMLKTTTSEVKPTPAAIDPRMLHDGEGVFTSGFPLDLPVLITTSGQIASSDPMAFEGMAPRGLRVLDIYWADLHVNPGNSGGPLFSLTSGSVIGMVDAFKDAPVIFEDLHNQGQGIVKEPGGDVSLHPLASNSGIAVVVPSRYVVELLQSKNIRCDVPKPAHARTE